MRLLALSLAFVALLAGCAMQPAKIIVIPAGQDALYDTYHYAPAVRVGDTVIVSGIPAGPGDTYEARVRNMFVRLRKTLEAAGASMADVVELTSFHAEPNDTPAFEAEFARLTPVFNEFFAEGYPAWTAVGTTALLAEGAPVEMRAVAVVGSGKRMRVQRTSAPTPR
jgi:enamine deaminase RidA (YjgF/YER057c/UK114 family)